MIDQWEDYEEISTADALCLMGEFIGKVDESQASSDDKRHAAIVLGIMHSMLESEYIWCGRASIVVEDEELMVEGNTAWVRRRKVLVN